MRSPWRRLAPRSVCAQRHARASGSRGGRSLERRYRCLVLMHLADATGSGHTASHRRSCEWAVICSGSGIAWHRRGNVPRGCGKGVGGARGARSEPISHLVITMVGVSRTQCETEWTGASPIPDITPCVPSTHAHTHRRPTDAHRTMAHTHKRGACVLVLAVAATAKAAITKVPGDPHAKAGLDPSALQDPRGRHRVGHLPRCAAATSPAADTRHIACCSCTSP